MPIIALQKYLLTWSCISLRTIIVTSVINVAVPLTLGTVPPLFAVLPLVILVHHGLSVWYLESLTVANDFRPLLPAILDWLMISGEITTWFGLGFFTWRVTRWDTSDFVVLVGSLFVQLVVLISLWVIRSISLVLQLLLRSCLPPDLSADLFAPSNDPPQNKNSPKVRRLQLIFGRSLWGQKFGRGKRGIFIVVRAILALGMFMGMIIFAIFSLVIWPVSETGMVPVKTLRSPSMQWGFQSLSPSWNIFVTLDRDIGLDSLGDAVRVTPLWENGVKRVRPCNSNGQNPPCQYEGREFFDGGASYNTPESLSVFSFRYFCPNRCSRNLTFEEFLEVPARDTMPDLLVTVNFTALGISPLASSVGGSRLKTLGIIVAFINDIDDVLRVSTPTSILPGMHLIGCVGMELTSLIANSRLAALGLVSRSHTFIAGHVYDLTQDPAPPSQDNATASLRLSVPSDYSDWYFIQEDREKSVLGGFSAVGGLWTALNGIFSFFFGGTLALLLWGQKPLSIFGLLDKPWQENIREEWKEERREAISKEAKVNALLDNDEWIMLLRKKLVDVNPLED